MLMIAYNIKQAFKQLWRNKGMAAAAVFAITAMMLILGLFFVISVNINKCPTGSEFRTQSL